MNLFAIIENNDEELICRIPLSQEIQREVIEQFTKLESSFFYEKELIEFEGSYKPGNDELFEIKEYSLNKDIIDSATNVLNYEILNVEELDGKIKAIYSTYVKSGNVEIYFQVFDTRKIIANRGISLYHKEGTYRRFEKKGIVILNNLTLVYRNNNIYFNSYFNTRRIVPLSDYYIEATKEDVEKFTTGYMLNFEDQNEFVEGLNSNLRKKIKSIEQRNVLKTMDAKNLREQAKEFGIDIKIENDKVKVPKDSKYIKQLIKFLDEDYFLTPLTSRKCVTNSKREMN